MKKCCKCKKQRSLDQFHKNKGAKDGLQKRCKVCACQATRNAYLNVTYKQSQVERSRRTVEMLRATVDEFKTIVGCTFCGESDACCLDFHHLDSTQKVKSVSVLVGHKNIKKLIQEIEKCICVCSNCHRKIHRARFTTEGKQAVVAEWLCTRLLTGAVNAM